MTRVDFYELKSGRFRPETLICQLCVKAYEQHKPLLLLTHSEQESKRFNHLLWQFDDIHFIPHEINPIKMSLPGINIFHQCHQQGEFEILFNISQQVPDCVGQFERAIELVHDDNKAIARDHFRYYKDRGYPLNHHTV